MNGVDETDETTNSVKFLSDDHDMHSSMLVEELASARKDLNEARTHHQKEVYWLRLELDTSRREKEALEDRLSELCRDYVQDLEVHEDKEEFQSSTTYSSDPAYVTGLLSTLKKYEASMLILDNQINMIKASSEAIVVIMKEEISDLVQEKCEVEKDLLNQLDQLYAEKQRVEVQLKQQEKANQHTNVRRLENADMTQDTDDASETANGLVKGSPENTSNDELAVGLSDSSFASKDQLTSENQAQGAETELDCNTTELQDLKEMKEAETDCHEGETEWQPIQTVAYWREEAEKLQVENRQLQGKIESMKQEVLMIRSSASTVATMTTSRDETHIYLDRITLLRTQTDGAMQVVESFMSQLKSDVNSPVLSALEKAMLVHGQLQLSLTTIELQIRNKAFLVLNEEKTSMDESLLEQQKVLFAKIDATYQEAMAAIVAIESELKVHGETLEAMKATYERTWIEETTEESDGPQRDTTTETPSVALTSDACVERAELENEDMPATLLISRQVFLRLRDEVLEVVKGVHLKNDVIRRLSAKVERQHAEEMKLKAELLRLKSFSLVEMKEPGFGFSVDPQNEETLTPEWSPWT